MDTLVEERIGAAGLAGARPAPFVVGRPRWEVCEEPGLEGFAVLCRRLTNAERAAIQEAHAAIVAANVGYFKLPPEKRAKAASPREMERALLAPYIVDWNAVGLTPEGDEKPLPPPADAGPDVFDAVEPDAYDWIARHVLLGYVVGGKAGAYSAPSPPTAGPSFAGSGGGTGEG